MKEILKFAMGDIGKESRKLKGADIEDDSYIAQLLLKYGCHQSRAFFGRGLHGEMKAHAIVDRISGLIEQLPCPLRIIVITSSVRVSPALGRQHAVRGPCEIPPQIVNQRFSIQGIGQSLTHAAVFQNWIV